MSMSFERHPIPVVGIPQKKQHKEYKGTHKYLVEFNTPYGPVGGAVEHSVYQQAEALWGEKQVLLSLVPVLMQVRGEFNAAGHYHQFEIQRIEKVDKPAAGASGKY